MLISRNVNFKEHFLKSYAPILFSIILNKCIFLNIKRETEEKQLLMKANILSH